MDEYRIATPARVLTEFHKIRSAAVKGISFKLVERERRIRSGEWKAVLVCESCGETVRLRGESSHEDFMSMDFAQAAAKAHRCVNK